MRLCLLILAVAVVALYHRLTDFDACERYGHDGHWTTPTLRTCTRCPTTWRRDPGDIAATTTNQPGGW